MRHLIRLAKTKADEWVNVVGASQALAQNIFRLKKVPRKGREDVWEESTYLVEGALEEMQVAAAHPGREEEPRLEARYLVRMRLSDAEEAGLQVEGSVL